MELAQKIVLKEKGHQAPIPLSDGLMATLFWRTEVDFDLHAYWRSKPRQVEKGMFKKKLVDEPGKDGRVYYSDMGSRRSLPFITLDEDAGVGNVIDHAGGNEENLRFFDISAHDYIAIAVHNYGKRNTVFSNYDAKVTLKTADGQHELIEVPLTSSEQGEYCVIALVDNTGIEPTLINVNHTQSGRPRVDEVLRTLGR